MSYVMLPSNYNVKPMTEQTINKPHYTPSSALKKVYKVLRRVFKPSTKGKFIINTEKGVKTMETRKVRKSRQKDEDSRLNDSIVTTFSTLSVEECENELNEQAESEAEAITRG